MRIASFDIGEKNFAFCIAEVADAVEKIDILKISHHNVKLKKTQTVIESCIKVSNILLNDDMILSCDHFIIEQQMRCNVRAQRLAQHVWSTLSTTFNEQVVKFVPSHMKTQHFLGKNTLNDRQRKIWSVKKVTQEGVLRPNQAHEKIITEIQSLSKKDDVCDTILQVIAYVSKLLLSRE
jgi:hypothetical protein